MLLLIDFKQYLAHRRNRVNQALSGLLPDEGSTRIDAAMRYALMGNGKRIRPILCMAAAEAVGSDPDDVLEQACAIELIHTYSLIHDDLPAMDDDPLRRGRPTLHIAFDEATAILAGDALLTMAFEMIAAANPTPVHSASARLQIIHRLALAAGHQGMIEGQMRDLTAEGQKLSLAELQALHEMKTGALIEASLYTGAVLSNALPRQIDALRIYGRSIGLAFQIVDDILNVTGDPDVIGKSTGTDAERQKNTYPSLLGLDESRRLARDSIQQALQALADFDNNAHPLRALAEYIVSRNR